MGAVYEAFFLLKRPFGAVRELQTVADAIARVPATWTRYDLNTMRMWKSWSPTRFLVDAQTQRTAMIRVEGEGGAMALVALGKRGEPPTLIVRLELDDPAEVETWFRAEVSSRGADDDAALPFERGGISPVAARDQYHKRMRGMSAAGDLEIAAWLSVLRPDRDPLRGPIDGLEAETIGSLRLYRVLDDPTIEPARAVSTWEALGEQIAAQ